MTKLSYSFWQKMSRRHKYGINTYPFPSIEQVGSSLHCFVLFQQYGATVCALECLDHTSVAGLVVDDWLLALLAELAPSSLLLLMFLLLCCCCICFLFFCL